jgi:phosphatidylserine decarboxylase
MRNAPLISVVSKQTTSNFSLFVENINFNRAPKKDHVDELIESYLEFGSAAGKLTVVKTAAFNDAGIVEYINADGQHSCRAVTAINERFPNDPPMTLEVIIVEAIDDDKETIQRYVAALNNTVLPWKPTQYVDLFAKAGISEYVTFQTRLADCKSKKIKLNLGEVINIYLGGTQSSHIRAYRKGVMKFADKQRSDKLLFEFEKISPILSGANVRRHVLGHMRSVKPTHFPRIASEIKKNKDVWSEDETIFMAQYAKLVVEKYKPMVKVQVAAMVTAKIATKTAAKTAKTAKVTPTKK